MLSDDDIWMLKLSYFEQSIEQEDLTDWWKVFELWFEEDTLISFDCDDRLVDEEICLLLLSWAEQSIGLECLWDWRSKDDDNSEDDFFVSPKSPKEATEKHSPSTRDFLIKISLV